MVRITHCCYTKCEQTFDNFNDKKDSGSNTPVARDSNDTQHAGSSENSIDRPNRIFLMQAYFDDNPRDLQVLRHDKDLHPARIQPHLKNVPEYLGEYCFDVNLHFTVQRQITGLCW